MTKLDSLFSVPRFDITLSPGLDWAPLSHSEYIHAESAATTKLHHDVRTKQSRHQTTLYILQILGIMGLNNKMDFLADLLVPRMATSIRTSRK